MHEDLLGYLLGALDASEHRRIERELAINPQLRRELDDLRRCIEPLESLHEELDPPLGLTDRVLQSLDQLDLGSEDAEEPSVSRGHAWDNRFSPLYDVHPRNSAAIRPSYYCVSDGIVLALVALVAFTLFLPALANSRFEARKVACQDNLQHIGRQLISFSTRQPDQRFPYVPISGNRAFAGVFAPTLLENEMIQGDSSFLLCPGLDRPVTPVAWHVPSFVEIDRTGQTELLQLQRKAAGSYAYSVGYVVQGRLQATRNRGRSQFALLADAPSWNLRYRTSANHGGLGQNICYEDGRIVFVSNLRDVPGDDPLRNNHGFAEAGTTPDDAVLLRSEMKPVIFDAGSVGVVEISQ